MNISASPILLPASQSSSSSAPLKLTKRKVQFISPAEEDNSWVNGFEIPKTFSTRTQECISTGILSQSCRTEITQTLVALMWVHTQRPSKYAYNAICSKLVKVHPTLADDAGDDAVAHVSIKR